MQPWGETQQLQRLDKKLTSEITGVEPSLGDETPQIQPEPGRLVPHLEEGHSCRGASLHWSRSGGSQADT